jgi:pimeloyl-ACP methyl ester carboxylesterase
VAFDRQFGGVRRFVEGDGVSLNLLEAGEASGPLIVFVHGFPDTHAVWLTTIARLVDEFRCVAYDVRGAGESAVPETRAGYRVSHLVSDLVAVIDSFSPGRPVHLVAHDWGSVQTWEAVLLAGSDPRLTGRIASYTTISGPAIGHLALWVRQGLRGSWKQRRLVARQLLHSWYILAFQVPWLPELALRRLLRSPESARRFLGSRHAAPSVARDAVNGLGLYRANLRQGPSARHSLRTGIPVQLIVPLRDPFLTPSVYDDLPGFCSDLTRHDLDAGHWVQASHPDEIARLVAEFARAHSPADPGSVREFIDDDDGYLAWLADHPDGFVINTARHPTPSYIVIHRAQCRTISGTPARGGHWTLDYIKLCGERAELESYARGTIGGPAHACGSCLRESA